MKFRTLATLCCAAITLSPMSALAGTLTNASVVLGNANVSTATTIVTTYTIETAMNGSSTNTILLVANYQGLILVDGACGSDITVRVNNVPLVSTGPCSIYGGNSIELKLGLGQTVAANSNVEITFPSSRATTGATPGTFIASLETQMNAGTPIDQPLAPPTYIIGAPTPVPTMAEWAMILFGLTLAGYAAVYIQRKRLAA